MLIRKFFCLNKSNVLITQTQGTAKNGLTVNKNGNAYGNSQTIYTEYVDLSHSHNVVLGTAYFSGSYYTTPISAFGSIGNYSTVDSGYTTTANLNHRHSATFTPSVSDNISISLGNGDNETRSNNFTYKIWKRTN